MVNSTQNDTTVIAVLGTIIYLGGFLGNLLSLTIFLPTEIRRVSTGLLFLCLTISNNIHLLTLFFEFLEAAYHVRIFRSDFMRCRVLYWLQNISRSSSSFIACTISLDRMFRAIHPTRAKQFCTCRTARRIILFYSVFFAFAFCFYLLPYMKEDAEGICSSECNQAFDQFMTRIWPPIRAVLVGLLPVSIMITANIRLWRQIRASKRRVGPRLSTVGHSSSTDTMLIFITISNVVVFILTQVPFHLYTTMAGYIHWIGDFRTPVLLWSSLYFGIGFYVYCLTSPYFRAKFISKIYKCFNREDPTAFRRHTISQRFPH